MGEHRPRPGTDLAANDNPVERPPCRPLDRDRTAATVDYIMAATESIKIPITNGHRVGANAIEQGLEANPPYRGRRLEQIPHPGHPLLILDRDTEPEVGQRPEA